jgi:NADPH:quinone reductase
MRAIEAETFSGYGGLRQVELPKPQPAKDRVLVRVTAAGVTPLDHTILSGGHPRAKAPLVLGNEGAGVVEDGGDSGLAVGSRVMFTGPYGVRENGAWQEWLLARPEDLAIVPDAIDDVVAASLPVAYLAAQITLTLAGFKPGKTVLAPAIGGSVGNATYQLARAQGAGKVISTAGSATKAARARQLGFEDVIDLCLSPAGTSTPIATSFQWQKPPQPNGSASIWSVRTPATPDSHVCPSSRRS